MEEARLVTATRNTRLAARLSWALLPYIGHHCDKESGTWRWWMRPVYWAWKLLDRLPGSDLFEPMEPRARNFEEPPA